MTVFLNDELARQVVENTLVRKIWKPFRGLVVADASGMVVTGAMIFNNYDQHDVHLTVILTKPISVCDTRYVTRYVFDELGCRRCTAVTSEFNMAARRALLKLGFKHEGTLRDHFEDANGLIYGLLRSEQKIAKLSNIVHLKRRVL